VVVRASPPTYPVELSDEAKAGAVDTFFTVIKEELDIQRPKAQVIEYLQEKAVFIDSAEANSTSDAGVSASQKRLVAAEQPKHPLNKCIASIVIAKYCDGLSLYALEKMISRDGQLDYSAIGGAPLINLAREHPLAYDYLQIDETRVQILKENGKTAQSDQ